MAEDELVRQVERTIAEGRLLDGGARFLTAVSGGADSTALLHMMWALRERHGWSVAAVHVNHGLRPGEADEEAQYVQRLCESLDMHCFVKQVDVSNALPSHGNNVQAAARALRLEAFGYAAGEWGTDTVALAHHGDDQAETVLMRLLRGTGPGGLTGIRPKAKVGGLQLVRPLLRVAKAELEAYCARHGLETRFDSSNASRYYFRNVIRLDILPFIMKLRPGAADSLRRVAEMSADEDDYMETAARDRLKGIAPQKDGTVRCGRALFNNSHIALQRRMIKIILNSLHLDSDSIDFAKIERIRLAIAVDRPTTTELRAGANLVFRRSYETLEWTRAAREKPEPYRFEMDVSHSGETALEQLEGALEWSVEPLESLLPRTFPDDPYEAWFDLDAAERPAIVRTRRPGDKLKPVGLNGSKKVKDMFVDGKLPKHLRDQWPIVTDSAGLVLWVPGFRRARAALVGDETKRVIRMRLRVSGNIF